MIEVIVMLLVALFGHAAIWVAVVNRVHAVGWSRPTIARITAVLFAVMAAIPLGIGWWLLRERPEILRGEASAHWLESLPLGIQLYTVLCWVGAVATVSRWFRRHVLHRPPRILRFHRTRSMAIREIPSTEPPHHFIVHLPGNESLQLDVTERVIDVPRLPAALDGLSLVHISDLHFTGRVGKTYFQEVVAQSNQLEPDLVAITGDLIDQMECLDWIPDTFGRLTASYGVYFVLGNHDVRVDARALAARLVNNGLVHLGGRWVETEIRGQRVILAGNESPWLGPAPELVNCPSREGGPPRIVLAHTPDQLPWARRCEADLMLAGHTHGGQIRFPFIGPIFIPSWTGVRYASGIFHAPPTILHVTRGVSGQLPVRVNCPPEIAHLKLHAMERHAT